MTGEDQVLPGESRAVSWRQGPLGRTLEHGVIWKGKPSEGRERSIGLLVTGHVREMGGDLGNGRQGGAAAGSSSKGEYHHEMPILKETQNYLFHYYETSGDTHSVLLHAGWRCIC